MKELYVDASNQILGRLASKIAKEILNGNKVYVVNAEKAVISGNPKYTIKVYLEKIQKGDPYHGPFFPKDPDRILRRTVRGMLPWKKPRGKQAYKRLKVYISVPEELKNKEFIKFKDAENKLENKFITLSEVCKRIGSKKV